MSKRWKLKTNSSNILLVLITLILIKAEWVTAQKDTSLEVINSIGDKHLTGEIQLLIGNDEIAQYYFQQSTDNNSLILDEVRQCLDSFQLITCIKMLLLDRVNQVVRFMEEPDIVGKDLHFLNGLMVFKSKNVTNRSGFSNNSDDLSLDEEIAVKILRIFRDRYLLINLLPKLKIQVEPNPETKSDFVCFSYKIHKEFEGDEIAEDNIIEGRRKKKGSGMGMMLVPPMIMLGLMPFTLASLKAMVMNAVMINMMALNGAIFMTIRNLVFGPRRGDNVKYVNYGYSKDRQTQSKKPVLIIHSPAAFVKQPPIKTKHFHRNPGKFHQESNHQGEYHISGDSYLPHYPQYENSENNDYYVIQQDYTDDGLNYEHHNRRTNKKKQGNISDKFNPPGRLKMNKYNNKNSQNTATYQRKSVKPEMKIQTNQNEKYNLNGSSLGLLHSNFVSKKSAGNYNYSRQVGEQPSLLF